MSGYMSGVTKKGIDLVSRITGLLNQLTAEDFEDTYVTLRVSIVEEDLNRELGFWSNEYDYGNNSRCNHFLVFVNECFRAAYSLLYVEHLLLFDFLFCHIFSFLVFNLFSLRTAKIVYFR